MAVPAVLRYVVIGLVVLAALVAFGSWLIRTRRVSPFRVPGRMLRGVTDPVMRPVERRIVRMGGNPVHAGGWLVVITAALGIVFLSLAGWLVTTLQVAYASATGGPRATFALIVNLVYRILFVALVVRVIAAWFGMFRYNRWIRPAYVLTDWIVEPLRRIIPPVGGFDLSPIVAVILLAIVRQIVLQGLHPCRRDSCFTSCRAPEQPPSSDVMATRSRSGSPRHRRAARPTPSSFGFLPRGWDVPAARSRSPQDNPAGGKPCQLVVWSRPRHFEFWRRDEAPQDAGQFCRRNDRWCRRQQGVRRVGRAARLYRRRAGGMVGGAADGLLRMINAQLS